MIDFSKKIKKETGVKKTNPLELYNDLDRSSKTGPLRPVQEYVLKEWYENRLENKDVIVKLHTGSGKTLIGLLMLQSKLYMGEGPCVFVCPNKYLADQVFYEARKFGIKICLIGEDNTLPTDFIDGKAILLTHVQKLFNGKTIFGLDNQYKKVKTIVLDDAHACLDSIKQAYTINIVRKEREVIYYKILALFENSLIEQGEGTYNDIKNNSDYESVMMIPYWDWIDKVSDVINILSSEVEQTYLKFVWPLLRDELENCDAYINGRQIQIIPHSFSIKRFGSFEKATQRILMSATTQDDIFFVKNLNISVEAIDKPIICEEKKWSGEKMIIIPSLIDEDFGRVKVIDYLCKFDWRQFGVCSLVPSRSKQRDYENLYCILINKDNIFTEVSRRQDGQYGRTLVVANRYDGIDLPDDACRILLMDSLPQFGNMSDVYEEKCRVDCDLIRRKIAQKIEQGLGRCVRGEKDYCCIFVLGADLVKFIRSVETRGYFSAQTRKQIEIGLNIVEMSGEDKTIKNEDYLWELATKSIQRDEGWKDYYKSEMEDLELENYISNRDALLVEKKAEDLFLSGEYEKSNLIMQNYLDNYDIPEEERGWYFQQMARRIYPNSRVESDKLQKVAFNLNRLLLKTKGELSYTPLLKINVARTHNIMTLLVSKGTYEELIMYVQTVLENFSLGVKAEKFEEAVNNIGCILGYECHRPDKLIRKGPDNLWHISNGKYMFFECKSEVSENRTYISKREVGQMENHCGWFENEYRDSSYVPIIVISTNKVADDANFTHDVKVMNKQLINKLKNNVLGFVKEFKNYDMHNLTEDFVQICLDKNHLSDMDIWQNYVADLN